MTDLHERVLDRKYRLVRLIGEGGMGSVWEAEHTMISRRVAVKVMHTETGDAKETVKRFFREAQSASAIGHPNIVEIFDVGVEEDGTAYIVMELLSGVSLESYLLDRGTLPPPRVVGIVLQVLSALHAAHRKGIIHRDMKPDNVFLAVDSRMREEVKLLDFGVAKVIAADSETLKLTKPGTVLGTPYYLSPEQARGAKDIDARIDVWSTGVMMYEMIAGRLPFEGDNYNEVISSILMKDPAPLSKVVPNIPRELAAVVTKAMAKDREQRFHSVGEMVKALMPLHDDLEERTTAAAARAVRDSVTPPPERAPASVDAPVGEAIGAPEPDPDKLDTLSQDLLVTLDPGRDAKSGKRWIWLLTAVGLVAAILIVAFLVGGGGSGEGSAEPGEEPSGTTAVAAAEPPPQVEPRDAASTVPDSDVAGPDTSAAVREPPAVDSVKITLTGLPPKAKLAIDGEPVENPFELPRSEQKFEIEVAAPGYVLYKRKVTPDRDRTLKLRLRKVGSGGKAGKGKKGDGWKTNPFG